VWWYTNWNPSYERLGEPPKEDLRPCLKKRKRKKKERKKHTFLNVILIQFLLL
jgi:hypothetical protein